MAVGRMQTPGLAAIEAAKADGRWARAYESQRNMTMPEDFAVALAEHPKARSFFDTFNRADRYAFFWRVSTAKTPSARGERILKYIAMLEAGRRFR